MKSPSQIEAVSLVGNEVGIGGAYPSLGFQPVRDAELGNGDYFGLYWPYGREDQEPIVCDMIHDEWALEIAFSNVPVFAEWLKVNDYARGEITVEDPGFVPRRFQEVKTIIRNQPEKAVSLLRQICEDFPESAEYWYTLASQLRRVGDHSGSYIAAIRAFASNWVFGMPPNGTLRMLQNARSHIEDPLIERSAELNMMYGGMKRNSNYDILKECIDAYLSSPTPVLGLLMNQNYGYMMYMETTSFQDRYDFNPAQWIEAHSQLCTEYLGDSRKKIT